MARMCSTCQFWEWDGGAAGVGECRRRSPRPFNTEETGPDSKYVYWPSTCANDWCGEHEKKVSE